MLSVISSCSASGGSEYCESSRSTVFGEIVVQKVAHGQVDRHRHVGPAPAPFSALADRPLQHVLGERDDQAGLLDGADERGRR